MAEYNWVYFDSISLISKNSVQPIKLAQSRTETKHQNKVAEYIKANVLVQTFLNSNKQRETRGKIDFFPVSFT